MPSDFECPYCASFESKLISNFHSAVLNAKTSVYQCGQCLNLFDFPRDVKRSELQKRLTDLQQDAEERTVVAVAANAIGVLDNQESAVRIARIQRESLTAQLDLIGQEIATINPLNQELLEKLREQEVDIQVKLIDVQRKELQTRLSDLQQDAEERTAVVRAMGRLNNQELGATIAQIQQESLTAQLSLIRQQIATVNSANEELLEELRRQEFDTQVKIIEAQKQEVQRKLRNLQEDAEEQISIAAAQNITIDAEGESQMMVVIYGYDSLMNCVPVDSYWANPSEIRSSNPKSETLTNLDVLTTSADSSVPHLLRLLFGVFQIILGFWLLCLAFGF